MFRSPMTECQRSVFRIVGYDDPLVVVGGQRDLGNAFGGDVVLSRSQSAKFCVIRLVVEKAILVIIFGHDVFHDSVLNALALLSSVSHTSLLSTMTIAKLLFAHTDVFVHLVRVHLRSQTYHLGYRSSTLRPSLIPEPFCSPSARGAGRSIIGGPIFIYSCSAQLISFEIVI